MTTDWTRYDVPAIASFLDEDLAVSWRQALAWEEAFSLLNGHSSRLRLAREALAESWSPQRSEASSLFMANIDEMVVTMADTADAAIINRDALIGVLSALESARVSIDQLHQKWQSYAVRQSASMARPEMPRISVPKDWQEHLNAQAHATMAAADQAIFDSTQKMIVPGGRGNFEQIVPLPAASSPERSGSPRFETTTPRGGAMAGTSAPANGADASLDAPTAPEPGGQGRPGVPGAPTPNGPSGPGVPSQDPPSIMESLGVIAPAALGAGLAMLPKPRTGVSARSARSTRQPSAESDAVKSGSGASEPLGAPMIASGGLRESDRHRSPPRKNTKWTVPTGVEGLIAPADRLVVHDLGPGVIGADH